MSGREIDACDDEELERLVDEVSVYARVSPEHKLRLVRALRRRGEVVAVTGDGVNDAPALKQADIGAAMGESGTDVAKEAADMVVTDDNFATIFAAVEEGRVAFDNVRKTTFFLISGNVAAVLAVLVSLGIGWALPFVAVQLLWLNLVTNGVQDVALAFEPGEKHLIDRPPRPPREGVISPLLWERTAIAALVMAAGTLVMFHLTLDGGGLEEARSVALTTMVVFQALHVGQLALGNAVGLRQEPVQQPLPVRRNHRGAGDPRRRALPAGDAVRARPGADRGSEVAGDLRHLAHGDRRSRAAQAGPPPSRGGRGRWLTFGHGWGRLIVVCIHIEARDRAVSIARPEARRR